MTRLWRRIPPQFLVFVGGGLLCALLDIGLMQLLIARGAAPLAATSAGFAAGLLLNYAFHARVTFGRLAAPASFARFLCVVALNYTITVALVALALALAAPALAGKLLSLPVVAVNGFLLSKHWIFK
jgi:putative flippase GtrA